MLAPFQANSDCSPKPFGIFDVTQAATSVYITRDCGNCSPRNIRSTLNQVRDSDPHPNPTP
eukprot:2140423-Pyramimonas_sp.AAC.1